MHFVISKRLKIMWAFEDLNKEKWFDGWYSALNWKKSIGIKNWAIERQLLNLNKKDCLS
jgi:hypothetical protein